MKQQAALFLPSDISPSRLAAYAAAVLYPYNGHDDLAGAGVTGNWPIERGDFFVDRLNGWANICGKNATLTPEELVLLVYFLSHPRLCLSYQMVCTVLWIQANSYGADESCAIEDLRRKIEPDQSHPIYLQDVPGSGYWFQYTKELSYSGKEQRISQCGAA
ncbi:MAG: helix-turn-helix domain-containing protein [Oscillospiraceae bacterium]|nr:helix-turn-helix domain-containing protein [Oscillospiraceae bacterium]